MASTQPPTNGAPGSHVAVLGGGPRRRRFDWPLIWLLRCPKPAGIDPSWDSLICSRVAVWQATIRQQLVQKTTAPQAWLGQRNMNN